MKNDFTKDFSCAVVIYDSNVVLIYHNMETCHEVAQGSIRDESHLEVIRPCGETNIFNEIRIGGQYYDDNKNGHSPVWVYWCDKTPYIPHPGLFGEALVQKIHAFYRAMDERKYVVKHISEATQQQETRRAFSLRVSKQNLMK